MPILLRCRILLLLLTMVPVVAGRLLIPAAPLTASLTPTPQVEVISEDEMRQPEGATWKHSHQYIQVEYFQHARPRPPPPSRKLFRGNVGTETIYGHRLLMGSAPPSCQGKCGTCVPCTPIHVSVGYSPVHTGSVTQQEYYPEVWRCKCGDETFMP